MEKLITYTIALKSLETLACCLSLISHQFEEQGWAH